LFSLSGAEFYPLGEYTGPVKSSKEPGSFVKPELWDEFFAGSRLACARLISLVENEPDSVPEIRDKLIPRLKEAVRVGITGPPGVGKSTVTAGLARRALKAGHSVGIVAVDPTSPFTGGAFLGDRVRMQSLISDPHVFIRSVASRDGHGGLSPATPHIADIFAAFGMDRVFIETVGVGQAELDVLSCSDLLVLVLQPGTGDVIQALKAGVIEAADLFLVNKADLPGTDVLLDSLKFLFDISARAKSRPLPPVLTASAVQNKGMDEVYKEVERLIEDYTASGLIREKKRSRLEQEIETSIKEELWEKFLTTAEAREDLRAVSEDLMRDGRSPYPYIRTICSKIQMKRVEEKDNRERNG
jgi:LAO/AO transport system kinase